MQARVTKKQEQTRINTRRNIKKLDAAETRQKLELLMEARLLKEHLADFWDLPVDKYGQIIYLYAQSNGSRL